MPAKIDKRSCTADEEAATAMTCLSHFRGGIQACRLAVKGVRAGPVRAWCQETSLSG